MKPPRTDLSIGTIIGESWAAMEMLRRMGFPSDDIYIVFGVMGAKDTMYDGEPCAAVLLKHDGKEFAFTVAPVRNVELFAKLWQRFIKNVNEKKVDQEELRTIFEQSYCFRHTAEMLAAIREKGFTIPKEAAFETKGAT
jgi:hypothetical protein